MATYKRPRTATQGGHGASLDNYSVSTEHFTAIVAKTGEDRQKTIFCKDELEEGVDLGAGLEAIDAMISELTNLKAKITELEAGAGL